MATYKDLASRLAPIGLDIVLPAVSEYALPCITLEPTGAEIRNGNAMVIDPNGNVIAETNKLGDDVVIAPCNRETAQNALGRKMLPGQFKKTIGVKTVDLKGAGFG